MHDEAKRAKPAACPVWSQGHLLRRGCLSWCNSWHPYKALGPNKKRQSWPCDVRSYLASSWCVLEIKRNLRHSCATATAKLLAQKPVELQQHIPKIALGDSVNQGHASFKLGHCDLLTNKHYGHHALTFPSWGTPLLLGLCPVQSLTPSKSMVWPTLWRPYDELPFHMGKHGAIPACFSQADGTLSQTAEIYTRAPACTVTRLQT